MNKMNMRDTEREKYFGWRAGKARFKISPMGGYKM